MKIENARVIAVGAAVVAAAVVVVAVVVWADTTIVGKQGHRNSMSESVSMKKKEGYHF